MNMHVKSVVNDRSISGQRARHDRPGSKTAPAAHTQRGAKKSVDDAIVLDDESEEWSMVSVARRLDAAGENATLRVLANCFHSARLNATFVRAREEEALHRAAALYPDQPEGVRVPGVFDRASPKVQHPDPSWPNWRRDLYAHWMEQCAAIDRGMGLPAHHKAAEEADSLIDSIAARIAAMPIRTLEDAVDKLGVLLWSQREDADSLSAKPFWEFSRELGALAEGVN